MSVKSILVKLKGEDGLSRPALSAASALSTLSKTVDRSTRSMSRSYAVQQAFTKQTYDMTQAMIIGASVANAMAQSVDRVGDKALVSTTKLGLLEAMTNSFNSSLGGLSVNVGMFTISLQDFSAQIPLLITTIGSAVTIIGAMTAAVIAATTAITGIMGAGFLGFLESIKERFDDVSTTAEAMQKVFEPLRQMFMDAIDPLVTQENIDFVIASIESLMSFINRTSQAIAQFRDEYVDFFVGLEVPFDKLATSINNMFVFDPDTTAIDSAGESLFRFINYLLKNLPRAITFANDTITKLHRPIVNTAGSIGELTRALINFVEIVGDEVLFVVRVFADFLKTLTRITNVLGGTVITSLIAQLAALVVVFYGLATVLDSFLHKGAMLYSWFEDTVGQAGSLGKQIHALSAAFLGWFSNTFPNLQDLGSAFARQIPVIGRYIDQYELLIARVKGTALTGFGGEMIQDEAGRILQVKPQLISRVESQLKAQGIDKSVYEAFAERNLFAMQRALEDTGFEATDVRFGLSRFRSRIFAVREITKQMSDDIGSVLNTLNRKYFEFFHDQIRGFGLYGAQFRGGLIKPLERLSVLTPRLKDVLNFEATGPRISGKAVLASAGPSQVVPFMTELGEHMDDAAETYLTGRIGIGTIVGRSPLEAFDGARFPVLNKGFIESQTVATEWQYVQRGVFQGFAETLRDARKTMSSFAGSMGSFASSIVGHLKHIGGETLRFSRLFFDAFAPISTLFVTLPLDAMMASTSGLGAIRLFYASIVGGLGTVLKEVNYQLRNKLTGLVTAPFAETAAAARKVFNRHILQGAGLIDERRFKRHFISKLKPLQASIGEGLPGVQTSIDAFAAYGELTFLDKMKAQFRLVGRFVRDTWGPTVVSALRGIEDAGRRSARVLLNSMRESFLFMAYFIKNTVKAAASSIGGAFIAAANVSIAFLTDIINLGLDPLRVAATKVSDTVRAGFVQAGTAARRMFSGGIIQRIDRMRDRLSFLNEEVYVFTGQISRPATNMFRETLEMEKMRFPQIRNLQIGIQSALSRRFENAREIVATQMNILSGVISGGFPEITDLELGIQQFLSRRFRNTRKAIKKQMSVFPAIVSEGTKEVRRNLKELDQAALSVFRGFAKPIQTAGDALARSFLNLGHITRGFVAGTILELQKLRENADVPMGGNIFAGLDQVGLISRKVTEDVPSAFKTLREEADSFTLLRPLTDSIKRLKNFSRAVLQSEGVLEGLRVAADRASSINLLRPFEAFGSVVDTMGAALDNLRGRLNRVTSTASTNFKTIRKTLAASADSFVSFSKRSIAAIRSFDLATHSSVQSVKNGLGLLSTAYTAVKGSIASYLKSLYAAITGQKALALSTAGVTVTTSNLSFAFLQTQLSAARANFAVVGLAGGLLSLAKSAILAYYNLLKAVGSFIVTMIFGGGLTAAISSAAASFNALNISIMGFHVATGGLAYVAMALAAAFLGFVGLAGQAGGAMGSLKTGFGAAKSAFMSVINVLVDIFVPIWNLLIDIINLILSPIYAIIDAANAIVDSLLPVTASGEQMGESFSLLSWVLGNFASIMGGLGEIIGFVADVLYYFVKTALLLFTVPADIIGAVIQKLFDFYHAIQNNQQVIAGVKAIKSVFESISNIIEGMMTFLINKLNYAIRLLNLIPTVDIEEIGEQERLASTRLKGAKITARQTKENISGDTAPPGEDAQTKTQKTEFNFNEYIENNTNVDAQPEDKQRIKGLVESALKDANTYRRQRDGRSG